MTAFTSCKTLFSRVLRGGTKRIKRREQQAPLPTQHAAHGCGTGGRSLVVGVAGFPSTNRSVTRHCEGGGATTARWPPLLSCLLPRSFVSHVDCLPAASSKAGAVEYGLVGVGPLCFAHAHRNPGSSARCRTRRNTSCRSASTMTSAAVMRDVLCFAAFHDTQETSHCASTYDWSVVKLL